MTHVINLASDLDSGIVRVMECRVAIRISTCAVMVSTKNGETSIYLK